MCSFIRRAVPGDEAALAFIQTESWKAAFHQILSPELLKRLTNIEQSEEMYRRLLQEHRGNGYILSVDNKPHCIAWWDSTREQDMPGYAEIICIHSLPGNWHRGYGSQMMDRLLADIACAGYSDVMLWVFADNERARRFYEAKGFRETGKTQPAYETLEICYERRL